MQKTAYELRNSDWSSDVCSSDLRVRRSLPCKPFVDCRMCKRRGCVLPRSSECRRESVLQAEYLPFRMSGHSTLVRNWRLHRGLAERLARCFGPRPPGKSAIAQHGRAACREKGWQYVEIWVGVVCSKKKKDKTYIE